MLTIINLDDVKTKNKTILEEKENRGLDLSGIKVHFLLYYLVLELKRSCKKKNLIKTSV